MAINQNPKILLEKSRQLYNTEGNKVLAASAKLTNVQILLKEKKLAEAEKELKAALTAFENAGNVRYELFAQWLHGEILSEKNEIEKAKSVFLATLKRAKNHSRQIEYLCLVSLGKLLNDESFFIEAVKITENSRAALASEDFRTTFLADKITPFNELAKIKLAQNKPQEAFIWHERSRARSISDAMNSSVSNHFENPKLNSLKDELNWLYNRINRLTETGLEARSQISSIKKDAAALEKQYVELSRRLQIVESSHTGEYSGFEVEAIQKNLRETALIEFANFGNRIFAFLITDQRFEVVNIEVGESNLKNEIEQFIFQIKTARFQDNLSEDNRKISFERILWRSQRLYDILIKPLEVICHGKRLKIVPSGALHYLPFQALHNGEQFLIETNEISYAPSAAVFQNCQASESHSFENALLVGMADEKTPLVKTEIETLGRLFDKSVVLFGKNASLENLEENLDSADILHLACHGSFRPDNPEFSSLALFAENLTAHQAKRLELKNKFVTLSACETGLSKIVSGEELIGLTRGFLSAGASSILMSLWTVNDRSTLDLMKVFYKKLANGESPGKALHHAQITALTENPNPFFWSPFVLTGK